MESVENHSPFCRFLYFTLCVINGKIKFNTIPLLRSVENDWFRKMVRRN